MKKDKIVVFGSFVVDLTSRGDKLPAPGETTIGRSFCSGPGGKGSNQGVAAHRAGADITMITKIGDDMFGKIATDFYENEGMNTDYVFIDKEHETGTALIMVDENSAENQILVVSGACGNITKSDIDKVEPIIAKAKYILLQLEINIDALEEIIDISLKHGVKVILNTAPVIPLSKELLSKVSIVTPNEHEAEAITGIKVNDEESANKAAEKLMDMGIDTVLITMGKDGVFVKTDKKSEFIKSIEVKSIDTTGAGDAFNGGFVTALSEGKDIFEAARFGNITGALSVTKLGTAPSMPYRKDIDEKIKHLNKIEVEK